MKRDAESLRKVALDRSRYQALVLSPISWNTPHPPYQPLLTTHDTGKTARGDQLTVSLVLMISAAMMRGLEQSDTDARRDRKTTKTI